MYIYIILTPSENYAYFSSIVFDTVFVKNFTILFFVYNRKAWAFSFILFIITIMQTVFESDRMIVLGEIKKYFYQSLIKNKNNPPSKKTISLKIIFQVNGKQTQFNYDFHIGMVEGNLTLVNWFEWNPIAELFFVMGYNFGTDPFHQNFRIIQTWINACNGTKD